MPFKITYNTQEDINEYNSFEEIINCNSVVKINCSNNQLTSLPDNMNFPNLKEFNCSYNQLTSLPDNMNFPNLQTFDCNNNELTSIPDNMNFPNLQTFHCPVNKLTLLPDNMNFPNLQTFNCHNNQLTTLPDNMNFPNLQAFYCFNNKLTSLPDNMNFPNLQTFCFFNNQLTSLPICILNFINLQKCMYYNNAIEMSLQIARFLDRINNLSINKLNIFTDNQNVHNSTIQLSVRDSINNITTRTDLKKYDIVLLHTLIIENTILTETSKSLLFEYVADTTVHSLLLLNFSEVLWFIIQTILTDFQIEEQQEIFKVLNQEIIDADCKCFTGRMNRSINCLNGFSPLVNINIKDGEQIGNIIILVKNKLELTGTYTVEQHKLEVEKELLERNYDIDTIKTWLEYIE
jgi:Leucine-rich repeat (LRR) protein